MLWPNYLNLGLIVVCTILLSPLGRLLKIKNFFASALVGISITALVVGFLANFCAGLIRPFVLVATLTGLFLHIKDFRKYDFRSNIAMYIALVGLGLLILLINNPVRLFIKDQILLFNPHYSYYANQATEMLGAHYFSRLRVAQFVPLEWARYHFFNASAQAAVQGPISHPNIFSYFFAQLVITIFSLLAILETLWKEFKFSLKNLIIGLAWITIGFTALANSITWNLMTTGTLTVGSLVLLIFALYKKDTDSYIVWAIIFGLSAFRIMPLSAIALMLLIIYLIKEKKFNLKAVIPNIYFALVYVLFVLYNLATIFLGSASGETQFNAASSKIFYHEGWIYPLFTYKIGGLVSRLLSSSLFLKYSNDGYANATLNPKVLLIILVFLGLVALGILIKFALVLFKQSKIQLLACAFVLVILALLVLKVSVNGKLLSLVTLPYLVFGLIFGYLLFDESKMRKLWMIFYSSLFLVAILFQFAPMGVEVKTPLLFAMCDIALWGLIGLFLFRRVKSIASIVLVLGLSLILIPVFNFHFINMLATDYKDRISLQAYADKNYKRDAFVEKDSNLCKLDFSSSLEIDAYSTLVGCNLKNDARNEGFLSHDFIAPEK